MDNQTFTKILDTAGLHTFTVPSGFEANVTVHLWGAGGNGGYYGSKGGGGGYAKGNVMLTAGATVSILVGGAGGSGPRDGQGVGGNGKNLFNGGSSGVAAPVPRNDDQNYGAGGGGGAASAIIVNSIPMLVAAGGGGGGGGKMDYGTIGGDGFAGGTSDTDQTLTALVVIDPRTGSSNHGYYIRDAGDRTSPSSITGARQYIVRLNGTTVWDSRSPPPNNYQPGTYRGSVYGIRDDGGITTSPTPSPNGDVLSAFDLILSGGPGLNTTQSGGMSSGGYSVGGGGGSGYPYGGRGGASYGDDAGNAGGGGGGQNYANAAVLSTTLLPGNGVTSGNEELKTSLGIPSIIGTAGYNGYAVLVFTKSIGVYVKDSTWKKLKKGYVKIPSSSTTVYRGVPPTTTNYNFGTHTFTVPPYVTSLSITAAGAGGGGGGSDSSPGSVGRPGAIIAGTISVSPGQTIVLQVGSGGFGGGNDTASAPGGAGGTNNFGYNGGRGSNAGPVPLSGGGGGGGAASVVLVNGSVYAVAAGGGGGAGGGNGVPGQGVSPGGNSSSIAGGDGQTKGGDGGGAGGGGGGHPTGGAGGSVNSGDVGGNSGADGQSLVPGGWTQTYSFNGGIQGVRGTRVSGRGGEGSITITYESLPLAEIVETGGWTEVRNLYHKKDGVWKNLYATNDIPMTLT
jgi:hypothetical protein